MREETLKRIHEKKVIAIVRGQQPAVMKELASAMLAGGVDLIEVTFPQSNPDGWKDTAESIHLLNTAFGGRIMAGAGTVLTEEQLHMAYDAGARYIITPNTDEKLIAEIRRLGLVALPGALTPSEIVRAYHAGADAVKVFPVDSLGPAYIKAVKAPLSHIPLMAVGGVTEKNAADYLRAGCMGLGVGGNLVNREWIANGEFDKITALAQEYMKIIREAI